MVLGLGGEVFGVSSLADLRGVLLDLLHVLLSLGLSVLHLGLQGGLHIVKLVGLFLLVLHDHLVDLLDLCLGLLDDGGVDLLMLLLGMVLLLLQLGLQFFPLSLDSAQSLLELV